MSLSDFFNSDLRTARGWDALDSKNGRPTTKVANERLMHAYKSRGMKMAAQALNAGACPDLLVETGRYHGGYGYGTTIYQSPMLVLAAEHKMHEFARLLIKHCANIDGCENRRGYSALHFAAENGDTPMARLLLDAGASGQGHYHTTGPLEIARGKQYTDIVEMIKAEPGRREAHKKAEIEAALLRAKEAEEAKKAELKRAKEEAIAVASKAPSVTQTGQNISVMEPLKLKRK